MGDNIALHSAFMQGILSRGLKKLIKKKVGVEADVDITSLDITQSDTGYWIEVSAKGHIQKSQLLDFVIKRF